MKTHTFTDGDFEMFRHAVNIFIVKLGITGWIIDVEHEQPGSPGRCAQLAFNVVSRQASITLAKHVEYEYSMEKDVAKLAKEEVLHLLLADFGWTAANTKDHCCDAVVAREHEVIYRLFNVL